MKLNLFSKAQEQKTKGQALVEFSLILPILLLILLGIIDFGRILVVYSGVSSAMRDAARNAEILGFTSAGVPTYRSCSTIIGDASNVILVDVDPANVRVLYYETGDLVDTDDIKAKKTNLEGYAVNPADVPVNEPSWDNYWEFADYDCAGDSVNGSVAGVDLTTGDIMVVTVSVNVEFMTPVMSSIFGQGLDINFRAQRSIVTNLRMEENAADRETDGLLDDWELEKIGCLWDVPDGTGTNNGTYDYTVHFDNDDKYIVRPTGLIVDPSTHLAVEDPNNSGENLYDPAALLYSGHVKPPFGDDEAIQAAHKAMLYARFKPTDSNLRDDITDLGWIEDACQYEQRTILIYTEDVDPADGIPDHPYTSIQAGCKEDDIDPVNFLQCPIPATDEFSVTNDPDGDNCNNGCEFANGTDPIQNLDGAISIDTDNDGLLDGEEVDNPDFPSDPAVWDTDGDGLSDGEEVLIYFTDPNKKDSDNDGLSDYDEAHYTHNGVSLALSNSDCDGDNDGILYLNDPDDPVNEDTSTCDTFLGGWDTDADGDGISDKDELDEYTITLPIDGIDKTITNTTNPMLSDSDGDGLTDYEELTGKDKDGNPIWIGEIIILDPMNADSDGDGVDDGDELQNFLNNGNDKNSVNYTDPYTSDTDGDGLLDSEEPGLYGTYPNDANSDDAFEGCPDFNGSGSYFYGDEFEGRGPLIEQAGGSNDADGDGIPNGLDANSDHHKDLPPELTNDNVELTDCVEMAQYGTNPYKSDTDDDGASDVQEINCPLLNPIIPEPNAAAIADSCTVTDNDDDGLDDIWEGELYFGCIHTVGGADFLSPAGTSYRNVGGVAVVVNDTGTLSYPTDCDGDASDPDQYYLAFNENDDPDQDGCDNACEDIRHTDPLNPDTDGDGLLDGAEIETSPLIADMDQDGLSDGEEVLTYFSDPLDKDSDNDGLNDKQEVDLGIHDSNVDCDGDNDGIIYSSDPDDPVNDHPETCVGGVNDPLGINDADTDGDGITDGAELSATPQTNPLKYDTDDDGLSDYFEVAISGTDPTLFDTDGDTLGDGEEINFYLTDATDPDTDNDKFTDGEEVNGFDMNIVFLNNGVPDPPVVVSIPGYDPNNPPDKNNPATYTLNPLNNDSDYDGWSDYWEVYYKQCDVNKSCDPPTIIDPSDKEGTNPVVPDTDGDGINDSIDGEPLDGTDIGDSDGDGLIDDDEINIWLTDPNDPDTDDDGLGDKFETSVAISIEYYTDSYTSGDPDGLHSGNIVLEGYEYDTDDDGLLDSYELYMYEIITGGTVPADVQAVIDAILAVGDPVYPDAEYPDTLVQCLYYTNNAIVPDPANGLHPGDYDTDGDGVGDGDECNVYLSDPLNAVAEDTTIEDKIPNQSFRDIVYLALEHKYNVIAIGAVNKLDANGRYPVAIIREPDGLGGYIDIGAAITAACGASSTWDGNTFTPIANTCGELDTNYDNDPTDQVWYAWVPPSGVYDLIQDAGVDKVNPN